MPSPSHRHTAPPRALDLPPPFRLITLREAGNAFAHAQAIAATEGAGTLVHVGRFDVAELAVVLEPEQPLRTARRAIYAGLVALADALAVAAPPEKPISFDWPDAVLVDGGVVGGARLAWPENAGEDAPGWLVFGATIRLVAMTADEPGLHPLSVTLAEEGFSDLGAGRLTESFARHLMVAIDAWQDAGFSAIAKAYLSRLPGEGMTIDDTGDLLVRSAGGAIERRDLRGALAAPGWLRRGGFS